MKGINYPFISNKQYEIKNNKLGYFCINAYLTENIQVKYKQDLFNLVKASNENNSLNAEIKENHNFKSTTLRSTFFSTKSGDSIKWNVMRITEEIKKQHDSFLRVNGYNRKIDRNAFYTEGCISGKEEFLGGKNELLNFYCNISPYSEYCINLFDKLDKKGVDKILKKVMDKPDIADMFFSNIDKAFKDN